MLRRSGTVADRISEKLRAASISSSSSSSGKTLSVDGKTLPAPPTPIRSLSPILQDSVVDRPHSPTREEGFIPPTDPDGRPTIQTQGPPLPSKNGSMPQSPILLSGLSLTPSTLRDLLQRFDAYLIMKPAPNSDVVSTAPRAQVLASRQKSTILGTYEKTFSGVEVVDWLIENVEGFGGDWHRSVEAADELTRMGYIARAGVGRDFEPTDETHYVVRLTPSDFVTSLNAQMATLKEFDPSALAARAQKMSAPLSAGTGEKVTSVLRSYLPAAMSGSDEPTYIRLRRDAAKADDAYREGVRAVEEKRLEMEEGLERGLRTWERWERERLGVVQTGTSPT